jgi:hypothetical protein
MAAANQPIDLDDITVEQSHRRRLQTLGMIGGSLVVTLAATLSLSVLAGVQLGEANSANHHDSSQENASSTWKDGKVTILSRGANLPLVVSLAPTSGPSLRPSVRPSESVQPSMLPSSNPTSSTSPSVHPSLTPSISAQPTESLLPTQSNVPTFSSKPSFSTSPSAVPSAFPSTKPSLSPTIKPTYLNQFRLRLHWKQGYNWQESYHESWWCLACATCDKSLFTASCDLKEVCEEGMMLGLVGCEPGKGGKIQAVEFAIHHNLFDKYSGDMISIHQTDLCITRKKRDVYIEKCTGEKGQRWNGFHPEKEFELQPFGKKDDKCLTQHHHPKRGERIFAEKCATARKTKTSLWIAY